MTMVSSDWQSQIFLKKIGGPNLGPTGLNQTHNEVFHQFIKFGSYDFPEIAYSDNLRQCLTSRRGKTLEKIFLGSNVS